MLERITRRERSDLLIAWLAISIAFTFIFIRVIVGLEEFIQLFLISMTTVGIGFVLHELAHKYSAIHFGYKAEFFKNNLMLLVAIAMAALVKIVFAVPGETRIYGYDIPKEHEGKISASGPVINLVLCLPFAILLYLSAFLQGPSIVISIISSIGIIGLRVNAMLAAFNMLPVGMLDGKKVLSWNPLVFVILIAAAFGILLSSYYFVAF